MIKAVIRTAIILAILVWALPSVSILNWVTLALASIVLTFLNGIIKPILKILLLPVNFVTFGLVGALLNVALLWLGTFLVPGFVIEPMAIFGIQLNQFFTLLALASLMSMMGSLIRFAF
jgi:putative membrane protein